MIKFLGSRKGKLDKREVKKKKGRQSLPEKLGTSISILSPSPAMNILTKKLL